MRKSVFILLTVFMACLLCKESENMPGTSRKFMDETFLNRGEENLLARQWQCEYIYSDLSFTSCKGQNENSKREKRDETIVK